MSMAYRRIEQDPDPEWFAEARREADSTSAMVGAVVLVILVLAGWGAFAALRWVLGAVG